MPGRSKQPPKRPKPRDRAPVEATSPWVVTTIRLKAEHWRALRLAALDRATSRGSGKPDASEVLREILDGWIARR